MLAHFRLPYSYLWVTFLAPTDQPESQCLDQSRTIDDQLNRYESSIQQEWTDESIEQAITLEEANVSRCNCEAINVEAHQPREASIVWQQLHEESHPRVSCVKDKAFDSDSANNEPLHNLQRSGTGPVCRYAVKLQGSDDMQQPLELTWQEHIGESLQDGCETYLNGVGQSTEAKNYREFNNIEKADLTWFDDSRLSRKLQWQSACQFSQQRRYINIK